MKQSYKVFFIIIYFLIISCSEGNKTYVEQAEKRVVLFYTFESESNFKSIDSLISYRLYQDFPYVEFKNYIKNKKIIVGNFKNKKMKNYKIATSTTGISEIFLEYTVDYTNHTTIEGFIIEQKEDTYKILAYNWKLCSAR